MARHYRRDSKETLRRKIMITVAAAATVIALFLFALTALRFYGTPAKVEHAAKRESPAVISEDAAAGEAVPEIKSEDAAEEKASGETKGKTPAKSKAQVKRAPDPVYLPPMGERPLLALLVDDGGFNMNIAIELSKLNMPMTWAIIPHTKYARQTAEHAAAHGIPYVVHMPMQAISDKTGNGEYIIGKGMDSASIKKRTAEAISRLPAPVGMNNHRGSLATSDAKIMSAVMETVKEHGLMFIDSRTSSNSVAYDVAVSKGVKALKNNCFIDGTTDVNTMHKRFNEAVNIALKRGNAVAICHFRPATLKFLRGLAQKKDSLPVRFVTIPEMASLVK